LGGHGYAPVEAGPRSCGRESWAPVSEWARGWQSTLARAKPPAGGGANVGALIAAGVSAIDLARDGTRYFGIHHAPDGTSDKVDPARLRSNVVLWAATPVILATSEKYELP